MLTSKRSTVQNVALGQSQNKPLIFDDSIFLQQFRQIFNALLQQTLLVVNIDTGCIVFEHVTYATVPAKTQTPYGLLILEHPVPGKLLGHGVDHGLRGKCRVTAHAVERLFFMQCCNLAGGDAIP